MVEEKKTLGRRSRDADPFETSVICAGDGYGGGGGHGGGYGGGSTGHGSACIGMGTDLGFFSGFFNRLYSIRGRARIFLACI